VTIILKRVGWECSSQGHVQINTNLYYILYQIQDVYSTHFSPLNKKLEFILNSGAPYILSNALYNAVPLP
jgi:hypothetical protein